MSTLASAVSLPSRRTDGPAERMRTNSSHQREGGTSPSGRETGTVSREVVRGAVVFKTEC